MPMPSVLEAERPMDPSDVTPYLLSFADNELLDLDNNEIISSFTISIPAAMTALGIALGTGDYTAVRTESNTAVKFWLIIADSDDRAASAFSQIGGTLCPVEVTVTTNAMPLRTIQRTGYVRIEQQV